LLLILAAGGIVGVLLCCGCSGLLLVWLRSSGVSLAEAAAAAARGEMPPAPTPNWANDWIAVSALSRAYTEALDAVAASKAVAEQLGEPIEQADPEVAGQLFRRHGTGELNPQQETIEFAISGPRGKGLVIVEAEQKAQSRHQFRPATITVRLEDGETIEIAPNGGSSGERDQ
jgi:hypothetical protein